MNLQVNRLSKRLPRRLPIGARYVIEGYGGAEGNLRVVARYVLMPDGDRINVPFEVPQPSAARALANRRSSHAKRFAPKVRSWTKLADGRGTGRSSKR